MTPPTVHMLDSLFWIAVSKLRAKWMPFTALNCSVLSPRLKLCFDNIVTHWVFFSFTATLYVVRRSQMDIYSDWIVHPCGCDIFFLHEPERCLFSKYCWWAGTHRCRSLPNITNILLRRSPLRYASRRLSSTWIILSFMVICLHVRSSFVLILVLCCCLQWYWLHEWPCCGRRDLWGGPHAWCTPGHD